MLKILLFRLKSGVFSEQGCQTIPRKINIYICFAYVIFGLNKFPKIILCKLLLLNLWCNIATKNQKTGLPDF